MKPLISLVGLGTLLTVASMACNANRQQSRWTSSAKAPMSETRSSQARPPQATRMSAASIPADVRYTTIDASVVQGVKRSLDVRLNRKVPEHVLRLIAMDLKERDPGKYERTFILYYLPGMKVGAGAWATTHFNPTLEVRILGLTIEREEALTKEPADKSGEVVGEWLDESPVIGGKITIYRQNGKLYMEHKYKDGSSSKEEMVEKASSSARRFEKKPPSSFGEYYVIDREGNLEIRDREGLIATARKIE